jgi:histidyl-tRNA synthetase
MARQLKNFKIELNSADNLRDLLQQIMELADEQINQAQNEINKLTNATTLKDEAMDGKAKYAKAVNDFLVTKNKATSQKIDVARMLEEVIKHNGDVKASMEDKNTSFNISDLQNLVDESMSKQSKANETKVLTLKKP